MFTILEWFAAWKSTDGREVVNDDFALETLIKGLLVPERLLAYIRYTKLSILKIQPLPIKSGINSKHL